MSGIHHRSQSHYPLTGSLYPWPADHSAWRVLTAEGKVCIALNIGRIPGKLPQTKNKRASHALHQIGVVGGHC